MAYNELKTAGARLAEIEAEKAKAEEWGSGNSRVKYRQLSDLDKEYRYIIGLIKTEDDLNKSVVELKVADNTSDRKVYAI